MIDPVDVPPMRSKYSHSRKSSLPLRFLSMLSITPRYSRVRMPRMPPPSSERMRLGGVFGSRCCCLLRGICVSSPPNRMRVVRTVFGRLAGYEDVNDAERCRPFLPLRASARTSPAYVVEFAISQQPSIGGHQGAAKLEHQAAVEIQPNSIRSRFTPWVRHGRLARSRVRC